MSAAEGATDHAGTWRWNSLCVTSHRCSSWTRLMTARCCAVLVLVQTVQFAQFLDKVVDMPVAVQRQVYVVGQSRKLWRSRVV